jgi:serine/threonine protein kinase/Flp pilus assembly protein TadD
MARTPLDPQAAGGHAEAADGAVIDRLVAEFGAAWQRGERPRAEDFLSRHEALRDDEALQLVFEEVCLRLDEGEVGLSAEFSRRFPQWRSRLGVLIDCKRLLNASRRAEFPEVGDDLGDFRLEAELGRGAAGRTFLARQRSLAGRLLVLKVIPAEQDEHLSLARLQHMNIVPLYFEQELPDRNLRLLGMPYLGGAPLARVLRALAPVPVAKRTGADLLEALDRCAPAFPGECPAGGPVRTYLARATFVQAVCWIGASLADALHYAHERRLVHLDVKPSNVLIAGDGQPMLLDFHLAREPVSPDGPHPESLGGTPGYCSPEQQAAIAAIQSGCPIPSAVDGRSDIYSLGLLLHDAIGGDLRAGLQRPRPLARCNPSASPGLSDLIGKCLAEDPSGRYPDAGALALDLRRHLNDLPLRGVANRSWVERWQKWRRRSPWASPGGTLRIVALAGLLAVIALAAVSLRQSDRRIDAAIAEGTALLHRGRHAEASRALSQGLQLVQRLPWPDRRQRLLKESLRRVARAETASALHETVELLRLRLGVVAPAPDEARDLYRRGLLIWTARDRIAPLGSQPIDAEAQVRTDLRDLATILADLRTRWSDAAGSPSPHATALAILQDAQARLGPSPALALDLERYARALGPPERSTAPISPPRNAWEHYDLGRSYLRAGEYSLAENELRRSIELRPDVFWPHYDHGLCCYRLGRYDEAAASLSTAIALAPRTAECYYNRALAHEARHRPDDALRDNTRALELAPAFSDAALNRGILLFRAGKLAEALDDFQRARSNTSSPRKVGLIRFNEALVHLARKDDAAASACLEDAIARGVDDARQLRERLRAR